jgi:hypothetical protein
MTTPARRSKRRPTRAEFDAHADADLKKRLAARLDEPGANGDGWVWIGPMMLVELGDIEHEVETGWMLRKLGAERHPEQVNVWRKPQQQEPTP